MKYIKYEQFQEEERYLRNRERLRREAFNTRTGYVDFDKPIRELINDEAFMALAYSVKDVFHEF